VNETWQPMTGTGNWSNMTKILNSTMGLSISYRFYANDTLGRWAIQALVHWLLEEMTMMLIRCG